MLNGNFYVWDKNLIDPYIYANTAFKIMKKTKQISKYQVYSSSFTLNLIKTIKHPK